MLKNIVLRSKIRKENLRRDTVKIQRQGVSKSRKTRRQKEG